MKKTHIIVDGKLKPMYKKNGMLTATALHEDYVNRKALSSGGYATMYRAPDVWVIKGFNPRFFFEEFYSLQECERFFKKLR